MTDTASGGPGEHPRYSIVVPVYDEQDNLPELHRRLVQWAEGIEGELEIVFVDDGSQDRSLRVIRELRREDERVHYVSLARNFGHQIAVTAGLNFARGDAVIVMDADLQDPPELLVDLVERWQEGFEVVYARRTGRQAEAWPKRLMAYSFYRVLRLVADIDIPADAGDFCLMDRKVVDLLNRMPERNRYVRGLRAWIGFRQTSVDFERAGRHGGDVKYTFRKSLALALNGIVSFSRAPLRIATYLGLASAALALIMAVMVVYWRLQYPEAPLSGFATILTVVFFLGAVQLVGIGILGEYIGRIYEEVKGRPIYTVAEVAGFGSDDGDRVPDLKRFDLKRRSADE